MSPWPGSGEILGAMPAHAGLDKEPLPGCAASRQEPSGFYNSQAIKFPFGQGCALPPLHPPAFLFSLWCLSSGQNRFLCI